jgi:glutamate-ammonia-ligase adenylyltransferase
VRSLDSYAAYYAKWSAVWEAQALLRATPMIGDRDLCARFTALIDPLRFPEDGITDDDVREIRRIKARVDDERLPRGADPNTHFKLGRGGLADVEWTIQLLQMQHAGSVESLRTTRTLDALTAAVDAELLELSDAQALATAWRTATGLRNAITQVRGRPADSLPRDARERAAVAHIRGYAPGESDELVNDYLKVTRRARQVVERLFWG